MTGAIISIQFLITLIVSNLLALWEMLILGSFKFLCAFGSSLLPDIDNIVFLFVLKIPDHEILNISQN